MQRSGNASLPLHGGKAPRWLFSRMKKLGRQIADVIIEEYGRAELVTRLSNPYWFQALGCTLGFDWHSSGLTTTTMGALKEALDPEEHGVQVVGGKGATSRKAPDEIETTPFNLSTSSIDQLKQASRMAAKVDNNCVQDSFSLYHHTLVFSEDGDWTVVQQGMSQDYARRYHWQSEEVDTFIDEPQNAICSQTRQDEALDLTSRISESTRQVSLDLVNDDPDRLKRYIRPAKQQSIADFTETHLSMPSHHELRDTDLTERSINQLKRAYEMQPESFEELVELKGIGAKSLRALALISELVYGAESSWEDPAKYSYTVGGKDGTPFPVDREHYDGVIDRLKDTIYKSEVGEREERKAFRRLHRYMQPA